jgi:hypothetical protein
MNAIATPSGRDTPESGRRTTIVIFAVLFVLGLAWALYTQHAWEDYYITYRASKNLATGQGLTYTAGERLHSFTSPLGVLLPAAASLLTGNSSDDAALWIFRLMSLTAFAGAGVLIWRMARRMFRGKIPAVLLVALFATDAKTVDFTVNGMETAFMLFFLAWFLHALFAAPARPWLQLGLAWGGLMWTRPDSFIPIVFLTVGMLIFGPFVPLWSARVKLLKTFLAAGAVCTAIYLPWILWAWWYYGSPIPHTIIAKGFDHPPVRLDTYLGWLLDFPSRIADGTSSLSTTFLPPYGAATGWPRLALGLSSLLAVIVAGTWLVPLARWPVRVVAFAFFGAHFYLTYWPNYPFPWYIPPVTLLAFIALCGLLDQGLHLAEVLGPRVELARTLRRCLLGAAGLLAAGSLALSLMAAVQLKWQQRIIEFGQRKQIGLWLKTQARSPRDTVFLEPLGYIGFYSGLKMYDWPGLASREVLAARRKIVTPFAGPDYWPELIRELQPSWLVLRQKEIEAIRHRDQALLGKLYRPVRTFDARPEILKHPHLPAIAYLLFDEHYEVFQKREDQSAGDFAAKPAHLVPITIDSFFRKNAAADITAMNDPVPGTIFAHAPSVLAVKVPPQARQLTGKFGLLPSAYADPHKATDGAEFSVDLVGADGTRRNLLTKLLVPLQHSEDQGAQGFTVDLPEGEDLRIEFVVSTGPQRNGAFDWTYWGSLNFVLPPY